MIDYIAIGHVTEDVWKDGSRTAGGTVMYSARAARRMAQTVAVFTAASVTLDTHTIFPDIRVQRLIAPTTTEFENIYTPNGRVQITRPCSIELTPDVAFYARKSSIVHLAPVCNEVSPAFVDELRPEVFIGVTPQGWLRRWDASGRVTQHPSNWTESDKVLARANCVVSSIEDVNGDWDVIHAWANKTNMLVATTGEKGCVLFTNGTRTDIAAPKVDEVEATGAGDIFAATLFLALQRGYEPAIACEFACCIAAQSVTRPNLQGLPTVEDLKRCSTIFE